MYKKILVLAMVVAFVAGCAAPATETPVATAPEVAEAPATEAVNECDWNFVMINKSMAFNWSKRMGTGADQFKEDTCINATMTGPSKADAALQLRVSEAVTAQPPAATLTPPQEVEPLEPVLKKARDAGIIVITHEATNQVNNDYDLEAFDNGDYGRHMMDQLATCMGEEGKYVMFVATLASKSHNEWADAAIEYQKTQYPNMELVGGKNESQDDGTIAYQIMADLLTTYPDLKGVQGSGALDVVGAGQAIQEAGLTGEVCAVGTSIPSYASELLADGTIYSVHAWDPATAVYAMNRIAQLMMEGKEITDGMDLGIPGYDGFKLVDGKVIYGSGAWIDMTTENMADYPF